MSKVPALAAPEAPRRVAVVASAFTFESFKIGALAEALASVNKPTALLPVVILSVPSWIVVPPVWVFAPVKIRVPAPILVMAPVAPVLAPEIVKAVVALVTSIVAVFPELIVKFRSVLALLPVYCSVLLPVKSKFAAALVDIPRPPATPPLLMVPMLRTPASIAVEPV